MKEQVSHRCAESTLGGRSRATKSNKWPRPQEKRPSKDNFKIHASLRNTPRPKKSKNDEEIRVLPSLLCTPVTIKSVRIQLYKFLLRVERGSRRGSGRGRTRITCLFFLAGAAESPITREVDPCQMLYKPNNSARFSLAVESLIHLYVCKIQSWSLWPF